ncbi:hypothetical protein ACS0TY_017568 [Phlomoides rotata]
MDHLHFLCTAFCFLTMFEFSLTIDTLSPVQTLDDGEVLTSPGQAFELGFFSPGKSTSKFLGIWYRATPDVVVWVANRNNPITNPPGVLSLAENGTLVIRSTDQRSKIWSSDPSRPASSPVLRLLDSGNLVLVDNSSNIWQSFDYPTDTRMPGMKTVGDPDSGINKYLTSWKSADDPSTGEFSFRIENNGLSQTVVKQGNKTTFRGIFWNGYFPGYPFSPGQAWNNEVETSRGRLVSLFNIFNGSSITKLTMNYSGMLQRYMMNEQRDGWTDMVESPHYSCDKYGFCGNNSICSSGKTPECECLRGFKPKSEREWEIFEWKSGCHRNLPFDCQKEDGFLRFETLNFPDSLDFRLNTSMSIGECHDECLNNCNCTAYADPLSNNNTSCLMWFGDLIDVRELISGDSRPMPSVYIRVPASELEPVTDRKEKKKGSGGKKLITAVAASGVGVLILGLLFGGLLLRMRRKKRARSTAYKRTREESELPLFDLATIVAATSNFARENLIGEGGFGPVYKGNLSAEQVIAVKRMSKTSRQGPEEFKNEVTLIAKLQHRNLVRILGCCTEGQEKMLIYEYMQNKSLDYFIFDESRSTELNWPRRFDIIMGITRGLLYLHHDSRLNIIHRDLKTSNILLDENLNSKISDFGLARMFQGDETIESTQKVAGTYGYMSPEYAFSGNFSIKSDVFSLGVVILEIVSGKKNRGFEHSSLYQNLLEQAWVYCTEGRELELMDPCYKDTYDESQVKRCIKVGLLCVQKTAEDRPIMSSVLLMLSSEDTVLPQPRKPGFFLQSSHRYSPAGGDKSKSSNAMSMTDIEAR